MEILNFDSFTIDSIEKYNDCFMLKFNYNVLLTDGNNLKYYNFNYDCTIETLVDNIELRLADLIIRMTQYIIEEQEFDYPLDVWNNISYIVDDDYNLYLSDLGANDDEVLDKVILINKNDVGRTNFIYFLKENVGNILRFYLYNNSSNFLSSRMLLGMNQFSQVLDEYLNNSHLYIELVNDSKLIDVKSKFHSYDNDYHEYIPF